MAYIGDFRLGDTFDTKFTTRQISGAPSTLSSSPVISAYVGNSTTELTAGITLSVDFDSRTGLNNVRVVATSGNGYATASNYQLVITTGTVNSVSVVGEVIAEFSIEARSALMPTTAARTLDVSAGGEAGLDWANIGSPTTSVALTGTSIITTQKVDVDTIKTNPVVNAGTVTFPTTATLASTINITAGTITTVTNLTNAPTAGDFTATMKTSIGTAVAASAVASVTGNVGGNVTGSVGSVVGAVGSVTGNVGGNVTGSVGSVVGLTPGNLDVAVSTRMATFTLPTNFSALAITAGGAVTAGTVSDKTGYALTGAYDAAKTASQAGDAMTLTSGGYNAAADALLARNIAGGSSTGRTVGQAVAVLRNKVDTVNGIVYATDDSTTLWTFVATTAAGNPITVIDPA